jgi:hypothetical protein
MTRITVDDPADWRAGDHAHVEWTEKDGARVTIDGPLRDSKYCTGDLLCGRVSVRFNGKPGDKMTAVVTRQVMDLPTTPGSVIRLADDQRPPEGESATVGGCIAVLSPESWFALDTSTSRVMRFQFLSYVTPGWTLIHDEGEA